MKWAVREECIQRAHRSPRDVAPGGEDQPLSPSGIAASAVPLVVVDSPTSRLQTTRCFTKPRRRSAKNARWSFRSVRRIGEWPRQWRDDIGEDQSCGWIGRQFPIEGLDGRLLCSETTGTASPDDKLGIKRSPGPWPSLPCRVLDRTELHLGDRMMPIAPLRGRREADDCSGPAPREYTLKGHRGHVVTLVDDHLAIGSHPIVHAVLRVTLWSMATSSRPVLLFPAADLSDRCIRDPEEHGELRFPLIQEGPPVDEHQVLHRRWATR